MSQARVSQGERIARIETTLELLKENAEGIQEEIRVMSKILDTNTRQLEIHIEGVRLAREQNDILKKDMDARIAPLQEHVIQVRTWTKILVAFAGAPAFAYYTLMAIAKAKELFGL